MFMCDRCRGRRPHPDPLPEGEGELDQAQCSWESGACTELMQLCVRTLERRNDEYVTKTAGAPRDAGRCITAVTSSASG